MALTLDEINSLIAALGVKIPDSILAEKARAEEFEARREEVSAAAGGKPADWRLKANFDELLKRAVDSAGQKQFDPAFKLLDEAAQLLQQPDDPPPPTPPPPPPLAAEIPAATPGEQAFREKWALAKQAWLDSLATVDRQIEKLRPQMEAAGDPDFKIIADRGLPALTENHKAPVMKALLELDGGAGLALKASAADAEAAIAAFKQHLDSFNLIRALDDHAQTAFGAPMTLRRELGKGLNALEQALQTLTAS